MVNKECLEFLDPIDEQAVADGMRPKPLLGRDGHPGEVFLVRLGEQMYAYKPIYDSATYVTKGLNGAISATEAFHRQMSILWNLDHPNLIKTRLGVLGNDGAGVLMDYIRQGGLRGYIENKKKEGVWDYTMVRRIAYEMAQGLAYLHSQGIVHQHLHINNILIDNDHVVITDFFPKEVLPGGATGTTKSRSHGEVRVVVPSYDMYGYALLVSQLVWAVSEPVVVVVVVVVRDDDDDDDDDDGKRDHVDAAVAACGKEGEMVLAEIISGCYHKESSKRPTAMDVVAMLEANGGGVHSSGEQQEQAGRPVAA